jgi:D-beta-D-heptose 7-phosphate kinase/D-beta-D-heptose 1-phosphate adenosyltransferase
MKTRDIIQNIKQLGIYNPKQFKEYLGYFRQKDKLEIYLQQDSATNNEIKKRIQSGTKTTPVKPDYNLSKRITRASSLSTLRDSATLGIVSGCFDLLHLGHIRGMAYAKQYLSKYPNPLLVVLTLSDKNIRTKKGNNRPILNINERLDMICNVKCIDYVIPLEQPNCLSVLEKLKPDYFFKANADRSQEIVKKEMELVEAYGGKVVVFPFRLKAEVKSTTKIIESVQL